MELLKRVIDGILDLAQKERMSVTFNFGEDKGVGVRYLSGNSEIMQILARFSVEADGTIKDPYRTGDSEHMAWVNQLDPQSSESAIHRPPPRQKELLDYCGQILSWFSLKS